MQLVSVCISMPSYARTHAHTHARTHARIYISSPFFVHPQCVCVPFFAATIISIYRGTSIGICWACLSAHLLPRPPGARTERMPKQEHANSSANGRMRALARCSFLSARACALLLLSLRIADTFQRNTRPSATRRFTNESTGPPSCLVRLSLKCRRRPSTPTCPPRRQPPPRSNSPRQQSFLPSTRCR